MLAQSVGGEDDGDAYNEALDKVLSLGAGAAEPESPEVVRISIKRA